MLTTYGLGCGINSVCVEEGLEIPESTSTTTPISITPSAIVLNIPKVSNFGWILGGGLVLMAIIGLMESKGRK